MFRKHRSLGCSTPVAIAVAQIEKISVKSNLFFIHKMILLKSNLVGPDTNLNSNSSGSIKAIIYVMIKKKLHILVA